MDQLGTFLPLIMMFVVIYFLMIRPQQKRQKQEKEFEKNLKVGDKIITRSGLHGKVLELNDNDNTIIMETLAGKLKMERSAVSLELSQKLNAPVEKK
ncbi:preprotein translocase subunit YajC [Flavobacterium suaedae]|uniref:Sec translocon accessory complex subunit YajC n=1 Tax=Flavobacterium suaedae TaxID=1767027 RepID=A0ABQ1JI72_9FLAO|nr:preprotein translocase subunit YajC [Flavobacterium suaedae]GGB67750.1 preprotein translocase subunit YajC [Flavobacterium suaedae]